MAATGIHLSTFHRSVPVLINRSRESLLMMEECAAVGSWLAPALVRIARALNTLRPNHPCRVMLADPRTVQPDDYLGANFAPEDRGNNRAAVLATRYGLSWGVEVGATHQSLFTDGATLTRAHYESTSLLVGTGNVTAQTIEKYLIQYSQWERSSWLINLSAENRTRGIGVGSAIDPKKLEKRFSLRKVCKDLPPVVFEMAPEQLARSSLERSIRLADDLNQAAEAADYALRLLSNNLRKHTTAMRRGKSTSQYILPDSPVNYRTQPFPYDKFDTAPRMTVQPPQGEISIALVGCGGTGSWLLPALVRIVRDLRDAGRKCHLTLIDPDHVELSNTFRQNFCEAEIGVKKVETLARRFATLLDVPLQVIVEEFRAEMVDSLGGDTLLLIGCVDNAEARQQIHRALTLRPNVWWLDSGNFYEEGQVRFGSTPQAQAQHHAGEWIALPSPGTQRPELLDPNARDLKKESAKRPAVSCEEMLLLSSQSLMVNFRAAALVTHYVAEWVTGQLRTQATSFDMPSGSTIPIYPS